jgi:hypothetical protein
MDAEGYPTKEELGFIRKYDVFKKPVRQLVEYIQERWRWDDYFVVRRKRDFFASVTSTDDHNPKRRWNVIVEMHTGGWSGSEDMIEALRKNRWFFFLYHNKWETGGHFYFKIPEDTWKKDGGIKD